MSKTDNEKSEEIPEIYKETYYLYRSYFDSLNAIRKYHNALSERTEVDVLMKNEKDGKFKKPSDELILSMVIHYKELVHSQKEREVDGREEEHIKKLKDLIESRPKFQFMHDNLLEGESSYYSNHPYVTQLIVALNSNKNIVEREKAQLKKNQLLNIISSFENFISNLFYYHYYYIHQDPNIFEDEKITYNQVIKLGDFNDLKKYLAEKKVTNVMHKTFKDWLKTFLNSVLSDKDKFLRKYSAEIEKLNEAFERRHLITHNNSIVNFSYVEKVDEKFKKNIEIGERLSIDEEYLDNIIDIIKKISVMIYCKFISKSVFKTNDFISIMNTDAIERIMDKDFEHAEEILNTLSKNVKDEELKNIIYYNTLIIERLSAEKIFNQKSCAQFFDSLNELNESDQLAKAILLDEDDKLDTIRLYLSNLPKETQIDMIHTWPLFKILEEEEEFIDFKKKILYSNNELEG